MPFSTTLDGSGDFARGRVLCASRSRYELHHIAYTDWCRSGERGTVICVHGLTRQGRDFDFLARALIDEGYRVICPDLVGRGLSGRLTNPVDYDLPQYVLDMTTLIASLGTNEVSWVGCSLGGQIGIILAGMPNSPIRRLLVNDIGPYMPVSAVLRIGRYVRHGPARFASNEVADRYFRDILAPFGNLTDDQWRHLVEHSIMPDEEGGYRFRFDRAIVRGFRPPWNYTDKLWSLWNQINCPILIFRGIESDLLLQETAEEMVARNTNAQLLVFADCGHLPPLLDNDQIQIVRDWLGGQIVGFSATERLVEARRARAKASRPESAKNARRS
jgi:pimeloyl-ACP methyl ester carboxylesterase